MNNAFYERLRQPSRDSAFDGYPVHPTLPSGFTELDRILPGGGWPENNVTEVLYDQPHIADLRLLLPALARLSRSDRWIACIAPPQAIDASQLAAQGVDISRILLVHPRTHHGDSTLRALERALRCGNCSAVLAWPTHADDRRLQRLQRAAQTGGTWGILFRKPDTSRQPSPAALQLRLGQDTQSAVITRLAYRGEIQHLRLRLDLDRPRVRSLPIHAATRKPHVEGGRTMKPATHSRLTRRTAPKRPLFPQMSLPLDIPENPTDGQLARQSRRSEEAASPQPKGLHRHF